MMDTADVSRITLCDDLKHLDSPHRQRYFDKLKSCGFEVDPYLLPPSVFMELRSCTASTIPDFGYHDLYHYVIHNPSPYTGNELKSYKSLDAYRYFVSGWVSHIRIWKLPGTDHNLIMAKVHHSYALSEDFLKPWVVVKDNGTVICGHCTCMAGLGEVCSHVAALLFGLESAVKNIRDRSCTDGQPEWGQIQGVTAGKDLFVMACDMDFSNPHSKKIKKKVGDAKGIPQMSEDEMKAFHQSLSNSGIKSALLSVLPDSCSNYIPVSASLPESLSSIYKPEYKGMATDTLLAVCEEAFHKIEISQEQARVIEESTREQATSNLWFEMRAGRITASKFKSVARTSVEKPCLSTIKQICYPVKMKFSTPATRWGCDHEQKAKEMFNTSSSQNHLNLKIYSSGLHINPEYPYLGASPDGLISCTCCGDGLLEIKCPFCKKDSAITSLIQDNMSCLESAPVHLKKTHEYYYQVQAQLFISSKAYCDFVLWTKKDLYVERIYFDEEFFYPILSKITSFFKLCILPELLAKKFSSQEINPNNSVINTSLWCYCKKIDNSTNMVICKNENCNIKQFHLKCLGLKNFPKKKWLCVECRAYQKSLKKMV